MSAARVMAQAKINLLLHVLAREAGGYHSIETVFLRIDLADAVTVRPGGSTRTLDCAGPAIPASGLGPPERNLAYRAAAAYADATGWPSGFAIEVDKHIPVGAGLGGGSADAGAVLRALDGLAPNPLGHRLPELAADLGADVPFMTLDSPMALAWGRGERLLPLPVLQPRPVVLCVPDFPIATADAYGWLSAGRGDYRPSAVALTPESLATWEGIVGIASNDFDDAIRPRFPIIGQMIDGLRSAGAEVAMLSGSGSTVFGIFGPGSELPDSTLDPRPSTLNPRPSTLDPRPSTLASGVRTLITRTSERVVRVEPNR